MGHPTGAWLGFINAVQSLGAFALYPVVAWSNNRFGRKKTIGVGYFWLVLGAALQAAAQNPAMFVIGRLCIGGTSAFFSASAPVLMTETAYPTHRGIITALFNCGWYVGSLLAAWATFGTRNYSDSWAWRIPSLLQICVPLAACIGYLMAPESPRWLGMSTTFYPSICCSQSSNSRAAPFESTASALDPRNLPVIRIMRTCTIGCINRELIFC